MATRIMSPQFAKGIFRVVGKLPPGFLKVECLRHAEPLSDANAYDMRDDLWIDEVPLDMVPMAKRLPNSLHLVTVRDRTVVTNVSVASPFGCGQGRDCASVSYRTSLPQPA